MELTDSHLSRVRDTAQALERAKAEYRDALLAARDWGCSNVAIARAAQKSEAAVRMYLKRKSWVG